MYVEIGYMDGDNVYALVMGDDRLYIGGAFMNAGGNIDADRIAARLIARVCLPLVIRQQGSHTTGISVCLTHVRRWLSLSKPAPHARIERYAQDRRMLLSARRSVPGSWFLFLITPIS